MLLIFEPQLDIFYNLLFPNTFTIEMRIIMTRLLALIFGLFITQLAISQDIPVFVNSSELLSENEVGGPICKAFVDVNGDYRDDIVRIANANKVLVDIQSNEGEFFQNFVIDTLVGDSWTIAVADVNNDGFSDILSAGNYNGAKVYTGGRDPMQYEKMFESETDFFAQGSNFVDMNNDGWLDAFICDDDGLSEIFINDQNGSFTRDTNFINMRTVPASDNSGNYGSEWTDIDGDGDLDLYIAKCRLGVDGFDDPRRVNTLFINDNGTYSEAAADFGLAVGAQTWTANFGDIDNDGDQDLFMINHEFRSQLFENIDNQEFVEIPLLNDGSEIITEGYQSAMEDFNNDGFLDILLVGGGDRLLLNDGNKSFTNTFTPMGSFQTFSFALGDANEDGFVDIISSYRPLGSGLNGDRDRLWLNLPNENHHVAFSLNGLQSNKSGVGSIIKIYGDWGVQTRIVKAGEGYGITNSLTTRFGLNDATSIDSVQIAWPSGVRTTYSDVDIDKHFIINEGDCMEELLTIETTGSRLDCLTGEVTLSTSDMSVGVWSNGETSNSITVSEPGNYSVVVDQAACENFGQVVIVRGPEELEVPKINIADDVIICEGQSVVIALRTDDQTEWSTGVTEESITVTESGEYFAINQNDCESIESEKVNVEFVDPSNLGSDFSTEFETQETAVTLEVNEENVSWYADSDGTVLVGSGPTYTTGLLSNDTIVYFDYSVTQQPPAYIGGVDIDVSVQEPRFEAETVLGSLFFVVDEPSVLKSFVVNSEAEGERRFLITDAIRQDTIHSKIVNVGIGVQTVELDFVMEQGSYEVKTDRAFNEMSMGRVNPQFSIIVGDLDYPYSVANVARISRSLFGQNFYHYFFDWKMEVLTEECTTDIQEFTITYDPMLSTTGTPESQGINIYPNPFSEIVTIEGIEKVKQINIYNNLNQLVKTVNTNNVTSIIDLSEMEEGHYIMTLSGDEFTVAQQLIKTK